MRDFEAPTPEVTVSESIKLEVLNPLKLNIWNVQFLLFIHVRPRLNKLHTFVTRKWF
jgi:hypothetical protein